MQPRDGSSAADHRGVDGTGSARPRSHSQARRLACALAGVSCAKISAVWNEATVLMSWRASWLLLPLTASCSLLFDTQAASQDAAPPADSRIADAIDAQGSVFPIVDGFEDLAIAEKWQTDFDGEALCITSDDQAFLGSRSLKCTTNATGGTAVISIDLEETSTVRVELDVFIELAAPQYTVFLRTSGGGAPEPQLSYSTFSLSRIFAGHEVPVSEIGSGFVSERLASTYPMEAWHHLVLSSSSGPSGPSGLASTLEGSTGDIVETVSVDTQGDRGPFSRVTIGIVETPSAVDEVVLYIDNLVITKM